MLFGTSRSLSSVSTGALCLPVQMQEVIDSLTNEVLLYMYMYMYMYVITFSDTYTCTYVAY